VLYLFLYFFFMLQRTLVSLALAGSLLAGSVGIVAAHDGPPFGLGLGLTAHLAAKADRGHDDDRGDHKDEAKKVDGVCMAAAVDARDTAIVAAVDAYHVSVKTALEARRSALKAAWMVENRDDRRDALEKAWDDFRRAWKKADHALKDARRMAWTTFEQERKKCAPAEAEGSARANISLDAKI
jgi:hypothetical protein